MDYAVDGTSAVEVARRHPCFDATAHDRVGRVHLPVAPRCNIQCAFCERKVCAALTMQHPGWAQRLATPAQALETVRGLVRQHPGECFVVGVAGPGDPLANAATFETLGRVHQEFPALLKCLSTNGLLLEQSLPRILEVGVTAITVTVNAPDGDTGQHIYRWVHLDGHTYRGREAAELLIASQLRGIRTALAAGLAVKVNCVLIPGVNDRHVTDLARSLKEADVRLMNIMPLIPAGRMRDRRAPTCEELNRARADCETLLPQFRHCTQCRADVVRFPRS
jgi:nitrogen fixation protein NifB